MLYSALTVLSFVMILIVPESPYWLIVFRSNQFEKAEQSMRWIYSDINVCVSFLNSLALPEHRHQFNKTNACIFQQLSVANLNWRTSRI